MTVRVPVRRAGGKDRDRRARLTYAAKDPSATVAAARGHLDSLLGMSGLTLREIAKIHGYSLKYVRSLSKRDHDCPDPVGSRKEALWRGAHAYLYNPVAIAGWMRSHRLGDDQWTTDRIASEFEVTVGVVAAARRRGQLARPDGYQLGRAWWRPSAAQSWWASRQVPAGAWVLAQISEYVGLRRPQGRPDFPPADGMAGTTRWWWSGTITEWWEPHAGRRVERLRARADAQDGAAPRGVDRWFGRDVAAHTGLSYEAVRTGG